MPLFGPPDIRKLTQKRDVKGLIKALSYRKDKEIRGKAAEALGKMRAFEAIPALIEALGDPEYRVHHAAENALSNMVKTAVPGLIKALQNPRTRKIAVNLLRKARAQQAVTPLVPLLKDQDADVRSGAARALGEIGDKQVCDALAPLLGDSVEYVRSSAANALKSLGWMPPTKADQARLLAALDQWDEMCKLGKAAVPALIEALKSRNFYHVRDAANALGELRDPTAIDALVRCLGHDRFEAQEAAAKALGKMGDSRAVDPLIAHFPNVPEVVRSAIIQSLGQLGGEKSVDLLIKILEEKGDNFRRSRAAKALGETGDPRAAAPLTQALNDKNSMVRKSAMESLEKVGGTQSLQSLIALANHKDRTLAKKGIQSLGELGDPEAVPTLINHLDNPFLTQSAREALVKIGKAAVPALINTVEHKAAKAQMAAAYVLGEIGEKRTIPPLAEALRAGTWSVRIIAAKALAKIHWHPESSKDKALFAIGRAQWDIVQNLGKDAVEPLMSALTESFLRAGAMQALGQTGHPKALEALLPYLNHDSWKTRKAAAQALIALHQGSGLSDAQKRTILKQKAVITSQHRDTRPHRDYAVCGEPHTDHRSHKDTGIGVDFPL